MNHLDLFAGIGGFSLGFGRAGMTTVGFCEIDPFCRAVLEKHWPDVPKFTDIKELTGEQIVDRCGPIDIISGGYPCQPFSLAGQRRGKEDDRHLWPELYRLVQEIRPTWCVFENVAGHITLGLDQVLSDMETEGYTCQTFILPAAGVDAPHRRNRTWIVAYSNGKRRNRRATEQGTHGRKKSARNGDVANTAKLFGHGSEYHASQNGRSTPQSGTRSSKNHVGNAVCTGLEGHAGHVQKECQSRRHKQNAKRSTSKAGLCSAKSARWPVEPGVGRVAHGIPRRVDRLKALGNAVVPQITEIIGRTILAASKQTGHFCPLI